MSDTVPRSAALVVVPSIPEVLADATILDRLPLDTLVVLQRQARYLEADLAAAITRHTMRAGQRSVQADPDRFLSPAEAATVFGVTARWLRDHADEIPGARRLSRKVIRFSERALRRHLNGMKA